MKIIKKGYTQAMKYAKKKAESMELKSLDTMEKPENMSVEDYSQLISLLKEMKQTYEDFYKNSSESLYAKYHLNDRCMTGILQFSMEELEAMEMDQMRKFLSKFIDASDKEALEQVNTMSEKELRNAMSVIKDASVMLFSTKMEYENILDDGMNLLNDFANYGSSHKLIELRKKRIERMKEYANSTTDDYEKHNTEKMIDTLEKSIDLSFISDRFEKLGEKEVLNIKNAFFDDKKGTYIIERYFDKIVRFGYKETIYREFFNIEENLMEEKYYPFNNLFLFIYLRYVAYANPSSKKDDIFVKSLTGAMVNLIYHHFISMQEEADFMNIIRTILDRFMPYSEEFIKENTMSPLNETRIRKEKDLTLEECEKILDKMREVGMDTTAYPLTDNKDKLREYKSSYDTYMKDLIKKQNAEHEAQLTENNQEDTSDEAPETPTDVPKRENSVTKNDLDVVSAKKSDSV